MSKKIKLVICSHPCSDAWCEHKFGHIKNTRCIGKCTPNKKSKCIGVKNKEV
jgi:hypothetical protein